MTALSFIVRNYSKCVSYTLQTIGSTEVYCEDKKKRHKGKDTVEEITALEKNMSIF